MTQNETNTQDSSTTDNNSIENGSAENGSTENGSTENGRIERAAADSAADTPASADTTVPPVKKATRKRAARKTAAPPDADSPDAGSPDAGSSDAGSSDAGSPDAGSPDPVASAADMPPSGPEPAKRPARKRATKKTAATVQSDNQPALIDEPVAEAPAAEAPAADLAEPARKTARKRTPRKTAATFSAPAVEAPLPAPEPIDIPTAPAMTAASVSALFQSPDPAAGRPARKRVARAAAPVEIPPVEIATFTPASAEEDEDQPLIASAADVQTVEVPDVEAAESGTDTVDSVVDPDTDGGAPKRRRRRGGRRHRKSGPDDGAEENTEATAADDTTDPQLAAAQTDDTDTSVISTGETTGDTTETTADDDDASEGEPDDGSADSSSRRRRRRRRRNGDPADVTPEDPADTVVKVREPREPREKRAREPREPRDDEVTSLEGSTRLQAKKIRRREGREAGRRRPPILTESEFLARREAVERKMVVRQRDDMTQVGVLEDGVLVEHYVSRESQGSMIGNIYLARVQNVLPSMEAAFVDVGRGRNAVLYAGEVDWAGLGLHGAPKRIELALKSGQQIVVQVSKDPIGHKGARLTSQVSLAGRYVVYVPGGGMSGISRKLPDTERARLKGILAGIVPDGASVVVRTAAEGASEVELTDDVNRLRTQWESITAQAETGNAPKLLYSEPDLLLKVVRDLFNSDFAALEVAGPEATEIVRHYVDHVAPTLADRVTSYADDYDVFAEYRADDQILKALERKVWLPSGGSLVIDRTEAMTVIDVNTGKFTGSGGSLEETVTKNNLEAAEEIVRQLRLRDIGGIIVVDFIDMVLEANRDLVLRRLVECLGRDRTKHQVAEVTSLGLVQMTRKRIGTGLLETFSVPCEHCNGRGVVIEAVPVQVKDDQHDANQSHGNNGGGGGRNRGNRGGSQGGQGSQSSASQQPQQTKTLDPGGILRVAATMGRHKAENETLDIDLDLDNSSVGSDVAESTDVSTLTDAEISEVTSEVSAVDQHTDTVTTEVPDAEVIDDSATTEDADANAPRSRRRRGRRGGRGRRSEVASEPLADGDDPDDFEPADLHPVLEPEVASEEEPEPVETSTLEPVDASVLTDEQPSDEQPSDETPSDETAAVADDDQEVAGSDVTDAVGVEPVALPVPADFEDDLAGDGDFPARSTDLSY